MEGATKTFSQHLYQGSAGLPARTTKVTQSPSMSAGLPRGNNNAGSPNTTEHRSTESEARPAVSLVTVHGFRTDSHRVGGR